MCKAHPAIDRSTKDPRNRKNPPFPCVKYEKEKRKRETNPTLASKSTIKPPDTHKIPSRKGKGKRRKEKTDNTCGFSTCRRVARKEEITLYFILPPFAVHTTAACEGVLVTVTKTVGYPVIVLTVVVLMVITVFVVVCCSGVGKSEKESWQRGLRRTRLTGCFRYNGESGLAALDGDDGGRRRRGRGFNGWKSSS